MTPSEREKLVIQRMSYQSNLRNLKFDYDEKLKEIRNNFEFKVNELGSIESINGRLKNENERLELLNRNLLQANNDFGEMLKRQQDSSESIKNDNIKKINELQDLIYGLEKSKKHLEFIIGDLVAKKEKEIGKLKEYKKQEKDFTVFQRGIKIQTEKLSRFKKLVESELVKLHKEKEKLKQDKKEFEIAKKDNDKKFTEWTRLEMKVQQYAKLLQQYYDAHNIKLFILNKFGLK